MFLKKVKKIFHHQTAETTHHNSKSGPEIDYLAAKKKQRAEQGVTALQAVLVGLPSEIWLQIFESLPNKDLGTVRCICADWWELADDDLLWKRKAEQDYPGESKDTEFGSWRDYYIHCANNKWTWREYESVKTDKEDKRQLTCTEVPKSFTYCPARIEQPVPDDHKSHYYEMTIVSKITSLGVGLCDESVDGYAYFVTTNSGIGYYAFGKTWNNGHDDATYPSFRQGSRVGILVNYTLKKVQFFIDGEAAKDKQPLDISWVTKTLYPVSLMERDNVIRFEGFKSKATYPPEVRELANTWDQ